jgi:hypothetical protein
MDVLYAGGFEEIVTRLNDDIELFREADAALTVILEPLWIENGWTIELIEAEAEKYQAELRRSKPDEVV